MFEVLYISQNSVSLKCASSYMHCWSWLFDIQCQLPKSSCLDLLSTSWCGHWHFFILLESGYETAFAIGHSKLCETADMSRVWNLSVRQKLSFTWALQWRWCKLCRSLFSCYNLYHDSHMQGISVFIFAIVTLEIAKTVLQYKTFRLEIYRVVYLPLQFSI